MNGIIALDVGARRIGVALARTDVKIASPLTTLEHNADVLQQIAQLVKENGVQTLVVGLPRGLDGQTTQQTEMVKAFVQELEKYLGMNIIFQDEALTSVKAENELAARSNKSYNKSDIDALAATYILEDYLGERT